jgi:thiol:disulfide interchange protein DsbG
VTRISLRLTLTLGAALIASSAIGAKEGGDIPERAKEFLEESAEIRSVHRLNAHLKAIVVEIAPGTGMTVVVDEAGEYLISGAIIDLESRDNLAETLTARAFPEPTTAEMYEEAESTHWIETGEGDLPPIYVIADTQCGYCQKMARQASVVGVERRIRWILVGFLGHTSMSQAAGLLDAPTEQAEAAAWAILTGRATGQPEEVSTDTARKVAQNNEWAERWGVMGTPVSLIPYDGEIRRVTGLPRPQLWDIIKQN